MNDLSIILGDVRPDLIKEETLPSLFRKTANEFADKTALIFHEEFLTYAELNRWSDEIALQLYKEGIKRGDKVGVWWQRGLPLHAIILGIVKAGAAYVPVDREIPAERVEVIMQEVGAAACYSMQQLNVNCLILNPPEKPQTVSAVASAENVISGSDCAYVLYTSGSTGKPKGIPISHSQICHLIRSEQSILQIKPTDKVYQGFSVSFDMWCEETWISYFAGATLWVADNTTSKAIDELSDTLRRENITILHAVPSLLAVMEDSLPGLRLVNAGGEACTPQVLAKWSKEGMRFFNSYGPTETTVTATMAQLGPHDHIVIGQPLPNYNLAVVDEALNLVPVGEAGELVITGPGVANGYVKLPQLTKEKFIAKPASLDALPGSMVYRTGDIAIINKDGSVDMQGRIDDQIKLRGYRIELGEIETKLNEIAGVRSAAVAVKKDFSDQEHLVGYVVTEGLACIDEGAFRMELSKGLPSYMIPSTIMVLAEMPRMPSGKINRKALPVPPLLSADSGSLGTLDLNAPIQDRILAVLSKIFPNRTIDPSMDFFTDLGGHSLLAAGFVSQLRRDAGLPNASLKDVYIHRPVNNLIQEWSTRAETAAKPKRVFNKIPLIRHITCWIAQTIALLIIYGLFAFQIFIPYLGYYYVDQETSNVLYSIITSLLLFSLIPPIFTAVCIGTKWIVIGKMKAGDYPLWGTYYFRWWFVKTMQRLLPAQFLNGTPLYPVYLRWLGVKIAPDAQISDFAFGAEDLITIGSDVSISSQTNLNNAFVEDGMLKLRTITLGDHAYIGSSAIISGGSTMEAWSELQDLSLLQPGKTIGQGEIWQGSPAQLKEKKDIEDLPQPLAVSAFTRRKYKLIFTLFIMIFPFIILLPLLPTIITINKLDNAAGDYDFTYMIGAPLLALVYIILFAAETIILTRLLQHDVKSGKYPIYSMFYVRKWFVDQLMALSLIVLHPIYATVYVASFFRALGAKIGKDTEISTASSVTHPLLEIGDGAFVADAVTLGEADIRGQQLILEKTTIEGNSFVGNSALIPQGYHLDGNMLIGVLSTPPDKQQMADNDARDWFGSPAIPLPRRQESNPFPPELTIHPKTSRKIARGLVEFIRIILPESAIICGSILFIAYGHDLVVDEPLWKIILYFPFYYLFYMGIPAFLITVLLKWAFIGKYKPKQRPMWSWNVWRSEAITSTYEALSIPFLLEYLQGTPWLPIVMRLLGVKTGKRVFMNTTDITEFDMVTICDDAALNADCGPQTHLFEDRVMKVGSVKIGARSSVGSGTIILYDSELGDDTNIEALSLVMKGERLSPGTDWTGSPVKPA
ncbi:amino acid adenylation domain-containing protein [Mucilaginibacter sp. BJC16-A38]|uniref:Pls/PosA family non-ribosomal peptide synthetase n=1 Tax=Mucilaginibacter phenanthrenivorans TaxID=1234842 RepID=UPI0021571EBF|nr:Pls/PosA family non-ribosomal peptide synthetase [Mucilaginibacter phenanthrenivorans]MCR8559774.1 amino acid adenylation domain-containing protein [Mucilaginibacter phenanthrenivorans]